MTSQNVLYFLILLLEQTLAIPAECREGYKFEGVEVTFDRSCQRNCSQWPPRIIGDTQFFNCSIGGMQDIKEYNKRHPNDFNLLRNSKASSGPYFEAPKINGIEIYFNDLEMALKFCFILPPGKMSQTVENSKMPKAILMTFSSIEEDPYSDKYYYMCSRQRLFQFHNYILLNSYDLFHPRNITYDCIVGLRRVNKTVYNITLQTAEGKSASYITTVVPRVQGTLNENSPWQPIIITYQNETDQSVTVIVEKPPLNLLSQLASYQVDILQELLSTVVESHTINLKDKNHTIFRHLNQGCYYVVVTSNCSKVCSQPTSSYGFKHLTDNCEQTLYLGYSDTMKTVAMISVCALVVTILLIVGACCMHKRRKYQELSIVSDMVLSGYIIHPYESDSSDYEIVNSLKCLIAEICKCSVQDYLQMKSNTSLAYSPEERIKNSLRKSNFVLILCSHSMMDQQNENNYSLDLYSYSNVVSLAIEQRKRSNDLRILEIRFPKEDHVCIPVLNINRKYIRTINFESEPEQLYCKMFGVKYPPGNNTRQVIKSNKNYQRILSLCSRAAQCGEERAIEDNCEIENNNAKVQEQYHGAGHEVIDVQNIFQKFREFNTSDDEKEERVAFLPPQQWSGHQNPIETASLPVLENDSRVSSFLTEADVHSSLEEGDNTSKDVSCSSTPTRRQVQLRRNKTYDTNLPSKRHKEAPYRSLPCDHVVEHQFKNSAENHHHSNLNGRKVFFADPFHLNTDMLRYREGNRHSNNRQRFNMPDEDRDGHKHIDQNEFPSYPHYSHHHQRNHHRLRQLDPCIHASTNHRDFYDEGHINIADQRMRSTGIDVPLNVNQFDYHARAFPYSEQPRMHQVHMNHCLQEHGPHMELDNMPCSRVGIKQDNFEMGMDQTIPKHSCQNFPPVNPHFVPLDPNSTEEMIRSSARGPISNDNRETVEKRLYMQNEWPITRSSSSRSLPNEMWTSPDDLDHEVNNSDIRTFEPYPPDDCEQSLDGSSEIFDELKRINENSKS